MKNLLFLLIILFQCLLLNYGYRITILDEYSYEFGRKSPYYLNFDNSKYDYIVFVNFIDTNSRLNFDIYSSNSKYYITSISLWAYYLYRDYSMLNPNQISDIIDTEFTDIPYTSVYSSVDGYHFSFYAEDMKNYYFYLAIHMPDDADPYSTYPLTIYSDYDEISTLAAIFIILIILGSCIALAGCSMGVAKLMGRSPLDGLLCFFILCALCCCRNR